VASIDGNPRPLGSIKDIFRRQFILFNPDRFTGPDTWRLNLPAEVNCAYSGDPCTSEHKLKTIEPIVHTNVNREYDLYFNIDSLTDAPKKYAFTRRLGVLVIPPQMVKSRARHCDIELIAAYPPLFSVFSGGNSNLKFNVAPLDPLPSTFSTSGSISYNTSRTVTTVTAELPVVADTVGLETTVSFDIKQLNPLP